MSAVELPSDDIREMLRDSLRGFLGEQWNADCVRYGPAPDDVAAIWSKLVGQGIAALGSDPGQGGLREIALVLAELGRAACPAPMWAAALANLALSTAPSEAASGLLTGLHGGTARLAFCFGSLDPDPGAGAIKVAGDRASGVLRFVEAAGSCTHLVVVANPRELALVALDIAGVNVVPSRAMGAWSLYEVRLNSVPATLIPIEAGVLDDLLIKAKLALSARAHGAASRAFELVTDYARERHQFGQPIGKFQAIQHKLANGLIALEGVRLVLDHATRLHDEGDRDWRYFAGCAVAFAGEALRRVSLETHHAFGAIGYADEHEAPLHFKRVHLDTIALGGSAHAKRSVASRLLDPGGVGLPEYDLGAAGNELRRQIKRWLEENWSEDRKAEFDRRPFSKREFDADFARDVGRMGWIGPDGPANLVGRRARRWSRSPLWRRWSMARRRGSAQRSRPMR